MATLASAHIAVRLLQGTFATVLHAQIHIQMLAAAFIRGRHLFHSEPSMVWRSFEGGVHSRAAFSRINTAFALHLDLRWFYVAVAQLHVAGTRNCQRWIRIGIRNKQIAQEVTTTNMRKFQRAYNNNVGQFQSEDIKFVHFISMLMQATKRLIDSTRWRQLSS